MGSPQATRFVGVGAPRSRQEHVVPVQARHICLLFRRFVSYENDVTRPYVDALEARGIPHLLVGGRSFHNRGEIETLRAALAAIEWPDDELSVFATLRGTLFAFGDEELLECRQRFGHFHPFRLPKDAPPHLSAIVDVFSLCKRSTDSEPGPCRHDDFHVARKHAGSRAVRARARGRASARECASRGRTRPPIRGRWRNLVPWLH